MPSHRELASLSRRDLFRMAASAGVALGGGAATGLIGEAGAGPDHPHARRCAEGPDGRERRFRTNKLTSFQEDLTILAQKTAEKQEPFAAVPSCADSRVPSRSSSTRRSATVRGPRSRATWPPRDRGEPRVRGGRPRTRLLIARALRVRRGDGGDRRQAVPGQISALYAPLRPAVDQAGPAPTPRSGRTPASRRACSARPRRSSPTWSPGKAEDRRRPLRHRERRGHSGLTFEAPTQTRGVTPSLTSSRETSKGGSGPWFDFVSSKRV
jgi:hypothetical protein